MAGVIIFTTFAIMNFANGQHHAIGLKPTEMRNSPDDMHPLPEERLAKEGISLTAPALIAVMQDPNWQEGIRALAALALGRMGDRAVTPDLIEASQKGDWQLRSAAVLALGKLQDTSAMDALRAGLQDASESVRSVTIQALSQIGGDEAIAALGEKLTDAAERSDNIRANAAFRLGNLGQASATPWLFSGLNDASLSVKTASAVALAKLGNADAIPALISVLEEDTARDSLVVKAIKGLRMLTGQDFGYPKPYYAPATKEERNEAIRGWIEWWEQQ